MSTHLEAMYAMDEALDMLFKRPSHVHDHTLEEDEATQDAPSPEEEISSVLHLTSRWSNGPDEDPEEWNSLPVYRFLNSQASPTAEPEGKNVCASPPAEPDADANATYDSGFGFMEEYQSGPPVPVRRFPMQSSSAQYLELQREVLKRHLACTTDLERHLPVDPDHHAGVRYHGMRLHFNNEEERKVRPEEERKANLKAERERQEEFSERRRIGFSRG